LIPADGYFEWKAESKTKPYFFGSKDGKPIAFAALWESWKHKSKVLDTCAILTTDANALAASVHNPMPVIRPALA
jgi:putative SOS response-associated peptidase YedK